ncbi:MAG: hypothetical protein FIA94_06255 [Nitrospirae bacterium]|nr:hypothetical protein [Nitrospirota bacterium]
MPFAIRITAGRVSMAAELFDTACARKIAAHLPVETVPNEWGDEFYFEIPVIMPHDQTATVNVNIGDIGYWPPGRALAIFFGPTPLSTGPEPVPASEVNIVGRITGDAGMLRTAKGTGVIRIEAC